LARANPACAAEIWAPEKEEMAMRKAVLLGTWMVAGAVAQTFPAEYRTDDKTVMERVRQLMQAMSNAPLDSAHEAFVQVPARRLYRTLDSQARTAALQTSLPLLKGIVMSDAVLKAHDEAIALSHGAVDHGLRLAPRPDPVQRAKEMMDRMQKDPSVMANPKFVEEFSRVQIEAANAGTESSFDQNLTFFTRPVAEVKNHLQTNRQMYSVDPAGKKCVDDALALADSNPDRFRLQAFRCSMAAMGAPKTEAEADRIRKERAQLLYDRMSSRAVIRRTLEEFVSVAQSVDFGAQTVVKGGTRVFVNPAYEKKSALWKMIYRNGREPTEVAVQFARAWLAELQPPAAAAKPAPAKAAPKK
jgi:hypothetical protein